MNKQQSPPQLLLQLFRWFCQPELLKYIEGDLMEIFEENVKKKGIKKQNGYS